MSKMINKQTDSELAEFYEYKEIGVKDVKENHSKADQEQFIKNCAKAVHKIIEWNKKATNEERQ